MHQKYIFSINCTHKVWSSDADIDNICDGLSGVALPLTTANSLQQINAIIINLEQISPLNANSRFKASWAGLLNCQMCGLRCNKAVWFCIFLSERFTHMTEALHLLKNFVDVWHHILALNHDGSVGAVPQSHMEHSAVLHIHSTSKQNTHSALWHWSFTVGCLYSWWSIDQWFLSQRQACVQQSLCHVV